MMIEKPLLDSGSHDGDSILIYLKFQSDNTVIGESNSFGALILLISKQKNKQMNLLLSANKKMKHDHLYNVKRMLQ